MILYVETNFVMSIAEGRDPAATRLLDDPPVRIVMPSVCLIEALTAFEGIRLSFEGFKQTLSHRIKQISRDVTSKHAAPLQKLLELALQEAADQFNDVESRLFNTLSLASERTEAIHPEPAIVRESVDNPLIEKEVRDNLILHCILHHSGRNLGEERAFLSGDGHFGRQEVKEVLRRSGVSKQFTRAEAFLEWLTSLHRGQDEEVSSPNLDP